MTPNDAAAVLVQAVEVARTVTCPEEYQAVWALLEPLAADAALSLRLGTGLLGSADPAARATGCDLLGLASDRDESVRGDAASAMVSLAAGESDDDVQWSIARALGATQDERALPVLVSLSEHDDPDVRFQVASSLPSVVTPSPEDPGIPVLIRLTGDPDPDVRNWATFGLGFLVDVDTPAVRAALWERLGDDCRDAREEGIRGLARRHDERAVGPLAELLDDDEGADLHTFEAAAVLGARELLPHLENYDPQSPWVAEALTACDPVLRARQDEAAWELLGTVQQRLPEAKVSLCAPRFDAGLTLDLATAGDAFSWSVGALLERSGGDPGRAAALVVADATSDRSDRSDTADRADRADRAD
ncbi:HEAT repeat domain-containing protein [Kitasatospora sp. NPDC097643]|uniref:HEAT repeat domain-containing protein n=1 Tax=Kitasatospora sp. NPDC097643 TaxID=3157230 RepID=UPI00332424BF